MIKDLINKQYNPAYLTGYPATLSDVEWFSLMSETIIKEKEWADPNYRMPTKLEEERRLAWRKNHQDDVFYDLNLLPKMPKYYINKAMGDYYTYEVRTDKNGRFRVPGSRVLRFFLEEVGMWSHPTSFEGLNQDQIKEIDQIFDAVLYGEDQDHPFSFEVKSERTYWAEGLILITGPRQYESYPLTNKRDTTLEILRFSVSLGNQYGVSYETILRLAGKLWHGPYFDDSDSYSFHQSVFFRRLQPEGKFHHRLLICEDLLGYFKEVYFEEYLGINYAEVVEEFNSDIEVFKEELGKKVDRLVQDNYIKFLLEYDQRLGNQVLDHMVQTREIGGFHFHRGWLKDYWNESLRKALTES